MGSKNKLLTKLGVHAASMRALEGRIAFWTIHVASVRVQSNQMIFKIGHMGTVQPTCGHYLLLH